MSLLNNLSNVATVAITKGGTLLVVLGEIAVEDALVLKKLQDLGPGVATNIRDLINFDVDKNADTMQVINAWRERCPIFLAIAKPNGIATTFSVGETAAAR